MRLRPAVRRSVPSVALMMMMMKIDVAAIDAASLGFDMLGGLSQADLMNPRRATRISPESPMAQPLYPTFVMLTGLCLPPGAQGSDDLKAEVAELHALVYRLQ